MNNAQALAAQTIRISVMAASTPVLLTAAWSAAAAKVIEWEIRTLAYSPLSAEATRQRRAGHRELANGAAKPNRRPQPAHP
ncbi:MAG TPA: hypothetical protein VMK13_07050 [Streptosporangiaceae bacterium]|nr:hypothetical protein [Streptosporangiaceae bacterium]